MAAPTINSPAFWNHRFATDWDANDGPAQTRFFAELALSMLPDWLRNDIDARRLGIHDLGCAFGDALPVLTRSFPGSVVSGSDISSVAIDIARARYPDFAFSVIGSAAHAAMADLVFCSNTIEHLIDWQAKLDSFAALTRDHLVVLAPFREQVLFHEHVVSFDFDTLPAVIGACAPMRLVHVAVRATSEMPGSRWVGHQFLAVWSRRPAPSGDRAGFGTLDDLDLRGVPIYGVSGCLRLAKAAYTSLDETRAMLRDLRRSSAEAEMCAHFAAIERENAFITTRVGLENDLHLARFDASRLTAALAAKESEAQTLAASLALRENEAEAGRSALDAARRQIDEARHAADAAASELAAAREAELEARSGAETSRRLAEDARTRAAAVQENLRVTRSETDEIARQLASARADVGVAEASAAAARADAVAARAALAAAQADTASAKAADEARWKAFEAELMRVQAALRADLETFRARLAVSERTGEAAIQAKVRSERAWGAREQALLTVRDDLERKLVELRGEMAHVAATAAAARESAAATLRAREQTWSAQLAELRSELQRFNDQLATRERSVQTSYDSLRQSHVRVLSMRTFQHLLKALRWYVRLRGDVMTMPTAPERLTVRIERLPVDRLIPAGSAASPLPAGVGAPPAVPLPLARPSGRPSPPRQTAAQGVPSASACIVQLVRSLDHGGLEQVVFDLATGFMAAGRHVVTIAVDRGGAIADRLVEAGGRVEILGGWDACAFAAIIDGLQIEAVLTHHCYDGLDMLAQRGVPVVEVVHNCYHWLQSDVAGYRARSAAVTRHVATSSAVADFHADVLGVSRDAIDVICNPLNSDGFIRPEPQLLRRIRRGHRGTFTFLSVAHFVPAKAHALLVSAFCEVHRVFPHTRLRLVGRPLDKAVHDAVRAQIAAAGTDHAVEFLLDGADRRALSRAYATAHVFVQPSVHEGFSIAMLEAAHFALPMILTEIGGAADCIGASGCGLLVPPHLPTLKGVTQARVEQAGRDPLPANRDALVEAMRTMVSDYDVWIDRGFSGQDWVTALSVGAVVQRYQAVLSSLPASLSSALPEVRA